MYILSKSSILKLVGKDADRILQVMSTNDFLKISIGQIVYACLLTPQSKFVADFFAYKISDDAFLIEIQHHLMKAFIDAFVKTKLLFKVVLEETNFVPIFYPSDPSGNLKLQYLGNDPRFDGAHRAVVYKEDVGLQSDDLEYRDLMLNKGVAYGDFLTNKSFILEYGFDKLNAISFNKGCYIGQEMIARAKHMNLVQKSLIVFCCSQEHSNNQGNVTVVSSEIREHVVLRDVNGDKMGQIVAVSRDKKTCLIQLKNQFPPQSFSILDEDNQIWFAVVVP